MATYIQLTSTNPKTIVSGTAELGVDISGLSSTDASFYDATIFISVYGLDAGVTARISIDVSTDSFDTFSTIYVTPANALVGPIGANAAYPLGPDDSPLGTDDIQSGEGDSTGFFPNPMTLSFRPFRDGLCSIGTPSGGTVVDQGIGTVVPWGISGGLIRLNLYQFPSTEAGKHITYQAWMTF